MAREKLNEIEKFKKDYAEQTYTFCDADSRFMTRRLRALARKAYRICSGVDDTFSGPHKTDKFKKTFGVRP